MNERLQKVLASAGYGSRRSCEVLIAAGRVRVNGVVVRTLGARADPATDRIEVDGKRVTLEAPHVYIAMHKPAGVTTTARDPHAARTVIELLPPGLSPRVLPVGRLDRETSGLLLFTDDGELAHRVTHPRFGVEKEYVALVGGRPSRAALDRLRRGVPVEGGATSPARVSLARPPFGDFPPEADSTWLRIVVHEGRKRLVRLMCAAVGHPVIALVRTRVGPVALGGLAPGRTRPLRARELDALRIDVGLAGRPPPRRTRPERYDGRRGRS